VIVDIGTGDGRYAYRSARANPDRFFIGIDVERRALEKVSEKVHRRPEKGGLSNVLFVHAPVEDLPAELDGMADEIHVHFPWGGLLRAVAVGEEGVLTGLRRIAAPGARLEVVIGLDEERDRAEFRRLGFPALTEDYLRSTLVPRYRMQGLASRTAESSRAPSGPNWRRRGRSGCAAAVGACSSSWPRRSRSPRGSAPRS
jgi:16S rRNA (adenine(1408)-N(1))-methyltransferase